MSCTDPRASAERLANEQPAIAQLKYGNLDGLVVLVQTYQVEAVHTALLIVGDLCTAEEIVQEAFLRAYRKIDQFDDHRPFGPWFLRSVINAALKAAERQKRGVPLEEPQDGSRAAEWLIDPGLGPQEIAENAEVSEAIWQALAQLTPGQRATVVMRYFLCEGENEMIQDLNWPLTTVKWWLHTARHRLRKILSPFHESEQECQEVDGE